jgi:hypothetical protein
MPRSEAPCVIEDGFLACACGICGKSVRARAPDDLTDGEQLPRWNHACGEDEPKAIAAAASARAQAAAPTHGPGTELKKLLQKVGITATPTCSCNARARRMDEEEAKSPGWCEAHLDEIVGWLREEATKRGLPFLDAAGRVLVRRAISNARKEAARATQAATAESGPA